MNILGIVAAKKQSLRFPGKNKYNFKGKPLFWHSVLPLMQSKHIRDVIVSSDCPEIQTFCKKNKVTVFTRHINAIENEAPLLGVLKHVCLNYSKNFDYVITIMANCPGHNLEDVEKAINMIKLNPDLNEIRSFDTSGNETGLMIFKKEVILQATAISSHIGAIESNGFEVHYKSDLERN